MKKAFFTGLLALFMCLPQALAAGGKAAKAIIVKGTVEALIDGKVIPVKRGDWLPEGAQVKTEPKSFTKLLFIDKSTMNVGPDSQMKIDAFPKKEAGIITLVKGQVRSKVTKNYMDMKDKDKSKLFIKTKTAAMGVRGTDFQVSFNPMNNATSLITFEGAVAMAKLVDSAMQGNRVSQRALEAVVSSKVAVMVRRGQYSGANPTLKNATIPIKISPIQFETLEKNETPGVAAEPDQAAASAKPKKQFRNIVPPGMDSKTVANDNSSADQMMKDTVGAIAVKVVEVQVAKELGELDQNAPPPEGTVDLATGSVAPTAGGFVDLATAQYVPPPPGSTYDANAGVYVPPPEVGTVDPATGSYKNDFYTLNADGTFTEKAPENFEQGPAPTGDGRTIASVEDGSAPPPEGGEKLAPPPPPPETNLITMETNIDPSLMGAAFEAGTGPGPAGTGGLVTGGPAGPEAEMLDQANELIMENEQVINDFNNSDNNLIFGEGTTTVNFDITVQ